MQSRDIETSQPGFSEVAIRVRAASLNYRDLLTADNAQIENIVPLSDGAGEIIALGASETINYKSTPDWDKEVWKLTRKRGVAHVLEVGGPDTLGRSLASLTEGGHIAQIGVLTGLDAPQTSLFPLVSKNAGMSGIYVGGVASFEQFARFLNATKIKPVIDRVFSFDEARAAYEYMQSGAHFGKVVIAI